MLSQARQFPFVVWVVILGTFLTRFTFFMVWPFLAVILHQKFGLNEAQVGLILGAGALSGTTLGLWIGNLSDQFGRQKVILTGCVLNILAFLTMAVADQVSMYVLGVILVGVSRSLLELPGKALISDVIDNIPIREMAFHLRYYLLNLGAAVGPAAGLAFGLTGQQETFFLTAVGYGIYTVGLIGAFVLMKRVGSHSQPQGDNSLATTLKLLAQDTAFQLLVVANILVMLCYSQVDAPLIQYLDGLAGEKTVSLYTWLIMTNSITILLLQFPMLKLVGRYHLDTRINIGVLLFGLAFVGFALIPNANPVLWIAGMVVLSVGEVILFPTLNLKIDRLAPAHLKGSYFGAASLFGFGWALGPIVGGALLHFFNGLALWLTMATFTLISFALVKKSTHAKRPDFENLESTSQATG